MLFVVCCLSVNSVVRCVLFVVRSSRMLLFWLVVRCCWLFVVVYVVDVVDVCVGCYLLIVAV